MVFVHSTTRAHQHTCECPGRHERALICPACVQPAPSLTASHRLASPRLASPHSPFTCDTSPAPPRPTAATVDNRSHA